MAPPTCGHLLRSNFAVPVQELRSRPHGSSRMRAPPQVKLRSVRSRTALETSWLLPHAGTSSGQTSQCPFKSCALSLTGFALSKQYLPILPASSQIVIYCFGTAHCFRANDTTAFTKFLPIYCIFFLIFRCCQYSHFLRCLFYLLIKSRIIIMPQIFAIIISPAITVF